MLARWGPLVLLIVISLGSAWILKELNDEQARIQEEAAHIPDFFMHGFSTTTMDDAGQPLRTLSADYIAHFSDTETKEIENPYLIVYHPTREPWHVKSERGWMSADDEVMLLLGEVEIWRNSAGGVREVEILTQDLRVLPETEYGETDKPVIIRTPTSETHSVGMRAFLQQRRVELLSQVTTVYEKITQ